MPAHRGWVPGVAGLRALRDDNRTALVTQAAEMLENGANLESVILNALRMIGSTREYQFA